MNRCEKMEDYKMIEQLITNIKEMVDSQKKFTIFIENDYCSYFRLYLLKKLCDVLNLDAEVMQMKGFDLFTEKWQVAPNDLQVISIHYSLFDWIMKRPSKIHDWLRHSSQRIDRVSYLISSEGQIDRRIVRDQATFVIYLLEQEDYFSLKHQKPSGLEPHHFYVKGKIRGRVSDEMGVVRFLELSNLQYNKSGWFDRIPLRNQFHKSKDASFFEVIIDRQEIQFLLDREEEKREEEFEKALLSIADE